MHKYYSSMISLIKSIVNMKKIVFCLLSAMFLTLAQAQTSRKVIKTSNLKTIYLTRGVNLLFTSPEPIQFVDLSTDKLVGDLPSVNIARVKIIQEEGSNSKSIKNKDLEQIGIISIVGQSFIAQYRVHYVAPNTPQYEAIKPMSNIQIQPEDMQPLEHIKEQYSDTELKRLCQVIHRLNINKDLRDKEKYGIEMTLRNTYIYGDYIFLDLEMENETNIKVDIDKLEFAIEDKSIYKATHHQRVILKPLFSFHKTQSFKKHYRNIFVFKKFTFPNGKRLKIRLVEDPISGRTLELKVKYSDILDADTF